MRRKKICHSRVRDGVKQEEGLSFLDRILKVLKAIFSFIFIILYWQILYFKIKICDSWSSLFLWILTFKKSQIRTQNLLLCSDPTKLKTIFCLFLICLSLFCLPIFLSSCVYLCVCLYLSLFVYVSVYLSFYLCICLFICLSIYVSVCFFVSLSMYLSVYKSFYLCVCLFICLSILPVSLSTRIPLSL